MMHTAVILLYWILIIYGPQILMNIEIRNGEILCKKCSSIQNNNSKSALNLPKSNVLLARLIKSRSTISCLSYNFRPLVQHFNNSEDDNTINLHSNYSYCNNNVLSMSLQNYHARQLNSLSHEELVDFLTSADLKNTISLFDGIYKIIEGSASRLKEYNEEIEPEFINYSKLRNYAGNNIPYDEYRMVQTNLKKGREFINTVIGMSNILGAAKEMYNLAQIREARINHHNSNSRITKDFNHSINISNNIGSNTTKSLDANVNYKIAENNDHQSNGLRHNNNKDTDKEVSMLHNKIPDCKENYTGTLLDLVLKDCANLQHTKHLNADRLSHAKNINQ